MSGHWFCSMEDEIKFYPAPSDQETRADGLICPGCRNKSLAWVPDSQPKMVSVSGARPVSPEQAAIEFAKMRRAIDGEEAL